AHGPGNMNNQILGVGVTSGGQQIERAVDDGHVGIAQMRGEPVGRDEPRAGRHRCHPTIVAAQHCKTLGALSLRARFHFSTLILPYSIEGFPHLLFARTISRCTNLEAKSSLFETSSTESAIAEKPIMASTCDGGANARIIFEKRNL